MLELADCIVFCAGQNHWPNQAVGPNLPFDEKNRAANFSTNEVEDLSNKKALHCLAPQRILSLSLYPKTLQPFQYCSFLFGYGVF